jgi:hypothetical protein
MRLDGNKHTWVFAREESGEPSEIRISFRPESFGASTAKLDFRNIGEIEVKPFFFP